MAEKIIHPEHHKNSEKLIDREHHEHAEKQRNAAAEQAKKELSELNLAKIREQAEAQAESSAEKNVAEAAKDSEPDNPIGTQKSLKARAYEQSLRSVQRRLSRPNKAFSKLVHSKVLDTVSNVSAETIARPSGLLGGSICAFLGSLGLLYSARHYGFRYNYLVFFMLFVGGFALGSILELVAWAAVKRKRHY